MKLNWDLIWSSILLTPLFLQLMNFCIDGRQRQMIINRRNSKQRETLLVFISLAVVVLFAGLRGRGVGDTGGYIRGYQALPDISAVSYSSISSKGSLFWYLSCLFKSITHASYQPWLFCIALISGTAVGRAIYKYSSHKWLSCYLFVANALFMYLFNGMRQFIPMAILFCKIDWVMDKKYIRFILLTAIMAQIHGSAWIFLLVIPLQRFKPFGKGMLAVIFASCVFGIFYDSFAESVNLVLQGTEFEGKGLEINGAGGSSVMRLLVSAVPVIISFIYRREIANENNRIVNFAVNGSAMCMSTYIVSTFTSGILVGRIAAYFNMFNIILLPCLAINLFKNKSRDLMVFAMIFLYGVYFYYQMYVAW